MFQRVERERERDEEKYGAPDIKQEPNREGSTLTLTYQIRASDDQVSARRRISIEGRANW
jgi:hypothetical protein